MKIELSEYDGESKGKRMGIYESQIVTEYKKKVNEYSIIFGEYELVFIPETSEDITHFCEEFMDNFIFPEHNPNVRVLLKKNGKLIREGKYTYGEFHKDTIKGKYDGVLSIHIETSDHHEYDIYFLPEPNETLLQIFDKIFHRKK